MPLRDRILDNVKTQNVLDTMGLQNKPNHTEMLLPALAIFGAGLAVGVSLALLFAPKPGNALRGDIRRGVGHLRTRGSHDEGADEAAQPTAHPKADNPYRDDVEE